ncbi:electron transport complex subunit RsxC [Colwellia sp. MEBiC06753]
MQSIINRIEHNHFWKFSGGVHPPEQKFLTTDKPIKPLLLPEQLVIPVQQHIGVAGDILVNIGDHVLKGQPLTAPSSPMAVPVHAPTSGTIEQIANHMTAHPSGLSELCIFLKPDGLDSWRPRNLCEDYHSIDKTDIVQKIANAGISGMGGAGFPTHIKVNNKPNIDFLIINAAECEPYITADDLLMREHAATIVDGINILKHLLVPQMVLIGIEDNKPEAIESLKKAVAGINGIHVCVLPTKYPTGGEKQLIKALTGREVPSGSLPISQGVVMQNVATCFAIAEAVIHDTPLIKRVVTVTGQGLAKPQNIWAAIGTPVKDLVAQCHNIQAKDKQVIIMGGPMMGFTLPSDKVPVIKTTNCLLVPNDKELALDNKEVECIRCGQCAEVCPSQLLPQELQWYAKAKDFDKLKQLNLFDCIDCGACAYVCPSHIPLVQYYRVAKAEIRHQDLQDIKAEKAKARFEARKARLERERKAREEKQRKASEARRAAMSAKTEEGQQAQSAVAAALARVKAKKAQSTGNTNIEESASPTVEPQANESNSDKQGESPVAAAIARAKAKKAAKAAELAASQQSSSASVEQKTENTPDNANRPTQASSSAADNTDKADRVAQAIARAKAKKAQAANKAEQEIDQKSEQRTEQATNAAEQAIQPNLALDTNDSSAKSQRVAAAVAKAKAKKAKKAQENKSPELVDEQHQQTSASSEQNDIATATEHEPETASDSNTQDNKAASAEVTPSTEAETAAQKKQRIAQAVAKAKAKKIANSQPAKDTGDNTEHQANNAPEHDKQAKIAAAIAKAKAKKQKREESN